MSTQRLDVGTKLSPIASAPAWTAEFASVVRVIPQSFTNRAALATLV